MEEKLFQYRCNREYHLWYMQGLSASSVRAGTSKCPTCGSLRIEPTGRVFTSPDPKRGWSVTTLEEETTT